LRVAGRKSRDTEAEELLVREFEKNAVVKAARSLRALLAR